MPAEVGGSPVISRLAENGPGPVKTGPYWTAGDVCPVWPYEEYDVVALTLADVTPGPRAPELARLFVSDGGERPAGKPCSARDGTDGVGTDGTPPGSTA